MERARYSAPARALHWLMAALILLSLPAGWLMVQDGIGRELRNVLFIYHKNAGVLIFLLVLLRLFTRWLRPPPPEPAHLPAWQARAARLSHASLYILMIAVPLAGYVRVRAGGFPIETLDALGIGTLVPRSDPLAELAKTVHYAAGLAIAALIALHVAAALRHGLLQRDGVFSRMWPPVGRGR